MTKMNSVLLMVAALLAFAGSVSAQTAHNASALSQMAVMQENYADSRVWV
jgi:hypothetical protein